MARADNIRHAESPVTQEVAGLSPLAAATAYVPRTLLEELSAHQKRPMPWLAEIDGTMVMGDISGFTAMSEQLAKSGREGAEQLTDIINSFFGTMLDIAVGYGGDTLTFGGDAVLLFFRGHDHARRAVASSLEMLAATAALDAYRVGSKRIRLGMSMGAHSGLFSFVAAGSERKAQFLALGPNTVRTASAETAASSGELAVTQDVLDVLGDALGAEPLGDGMWKVLDVARDGLAPVVLDYAPGRSIESLVRPHLPPFASAALGKGITPHELPGEHRKVTIVFVNVTGVDELLGRADRGQLLAELQTYLTHALDSIEERDGYLVSNDIYTDGFKLIVTFGAPAAHEHDAENAVRFVLDLRSRIEAAGLTLQHRFGINRGPVYAGDVGPPYRRQYTVMGDAVNLSARLMSHAAAGGALTTQELAAMAGPSFIREDLEPIRVKGKEHPIAVCELIDESDRQEQRARGDTPLVGRETELAEMLEALAKAARGSGRALLLQGEAGIGKSRLADEFIDTAQAQGWRTLSSACYEHTRSTPYAPWLPLLRQLLDLTTCTSDRQYRARIEEAVRRLAPKHVELASLLGPLVGATMPDSRIVRSLNKAAKRRALFELVATLIAGAAAEQPTLLAIEDTHWSDSSSSSLLSAVAQACLGQRPILLLLSQRTVPTPTVQLPAEYATVVSLAPLPPSAAASLLGDAESLAGAPDVIARALVDRANGNPLFLQELARSVRESGLLERLKSASAVAVQHALDDLEFPDRVETLLMSRVDLLEPSAKETVRRAAVIGQVFDVTSLLALSSERGLSQLESQLQSLASLDLIEPQHADSLTYRFVHPLVQEVAYGSLRFDTRRSLHHRFAEHLEALWAEDMDAHLDEVVRHYLRSGDRPKTLTYASQAAERADTVHAHREAIDYCRIALQAATSHSSTSILMRSALVERIGDSLQIMGCHRDAIDAYRNALERWNRIEDRMLTEHPPVPSAVPEESRALDARRAILCHKIALCYERENRRYDLADRWVIKALEHLPDGSTPLRAWMYTTRGISQMRQGRCDEALSWITTAVECARETEDPSAIAWALNQQSVLYGDSGDLARAIITQREVVDILENLGDLERLTTAYNNLAYCFMQRGELDDALTYNEKALELELRIGFTDRVTVSRVNIGEIRVVLGQYDEAIGDLAPALEASTAAGSDALSGFILANLSRAYSGLGDLERAKECIDRGIALLRRAGARAVLAEANVQLADVLRLDGHPRDAVSLCRRACGELLRRGNRTACIRALRVRARAHASLGDGAAAAQAIAESIDLAREIGAAAELARSLAARTELGREMATLAT